MTIQILNPYSYFTARNGTPLNEGYVYIGEPNQNPETNPVACFFDAELTIPAAQPLRTENGYIVDNTNAPATVYTASSYSIRVRSSNLTQIFFRANVSNLQGELSGPDGSSYIGFIQAGTGAVAQTVQTKLRNVAINPIDFGAAGNGTTDDTAAIQAMFDYVEALKVPVAMDFLGKKYKITSGLTFPRVVPELSGGGPAYRTPPVFIYGNGATIETTQTSGSMFSDTPANQTEADLKIQTACPIVMSGFYLYGPNVGNVATGTVTGINMSASYCAAISDCEIAFVNRGVVMTFCLAPTLERVRVTAPKEYGFLFQSSVGVRGGPAVWTGGDTGTSPTNLPHVINCRVYQIANCLASFAQFAVDGAEYTECVAEGPGWGGGWDFLHDDLDAGTVMSVIYRSPHCECQNAKANFRLRSKSTILIEHLSRQYAAPVVDAANSVAGAVTMAGTGYWLNLPSGGTKTFYHSDGGGVGGTPSGTSSGFGWIFRDNVLASTAFELNTNWENNTLPVGGINVGISSLDQGAQLWASGVQRIRTGTGGVIFNNKITFETDNSVDIGATGAKPRNVIAGTAVQAPTFIHDTLTFATLGSSAIGYRKFITDCNTTTFNASAAGGGTNQVPVFGTGTGWKVG